MSQLQKNDVIPLHISGYGSSGEGIARLSDGRVVFVKDALRGERCQVHLLKLGKSAVWGRVQEVLEASPARRKPDCPYYPRCGGCQTRHMSYEEELSFKKQRVEDCLQRIGGADIRVEVIHGADDPQRYRNKVQFPVAPGEKEACIGFYRARSHDVIDVEDCLLQPLAATRLRRAVKDWMVDYGVPAYEERGHTGLIRHLYVRTNERGESLCALVINGKGIPHGEELLERLRQAEPGLRGISLSINREKTNVILGQEQRNLWGETFLEDSQCGLQFRLSVPSFYQVNRNQTQVLYGRALAFAALQGTETVLDLYCGIGTITLMLAQKAGRVIGAEVVPQAIEDARENARRNGIENVEFICGDAGQTAQILAKRGIRPEVICVDPPRKGLAGEVIETIVSMQPLRVVYVSCDPATLARDIKAFAQGGYALKKVEACDMFPRTVHVECVVLMSKIQK